MDGPVWQQGAYRRRCAHGLTGYRGERLTNVQDLDIVTVEALPGVLDIAPLPQ